MVLVQEVYEMVILVCVCRALYHPPTHADLNVLSTPPPLHSPTRFPLPQGPIGVIERFTGEHALVTVLTVRQVEQVEEFHQCAQMGDPWEEEYLIKPPLHSPHSS